MMSHRTTDATSALIREDIRREIQRRLKEVEQEEDVCIFYACESGSRAWGFPSEDSDYDVRFLYLHRKAWYLSIDDKRDVIERPINDEIDLSGWDIRKALKLFRKSNPPMLEWLSSPILYQSRLTVAEKIKALVPEYYSPRACLYHYHNMAVSNVRAYLQGDEVWVKKYFYVLRPVLACKWIEAGYGAVPIEFDVLVNRVVTDPALKSEIDKLLIRKKSGQELDKGPRIAAISDFLDMEIMRLTTAEPGKNLELPDTENLDLLFRAAVEEPW